jgi:EAL and modified HD-GYP domain-containing signal transduction protein
MANNIYIAKQPILDKNGDVFAYELLYRDSVDTSNIKNRKEATVFVLSSVINRFGITNLLNQNKAFVKADKEFIMHSVVETIPKDYFIFSLQFEQEIEEKVKKRIEKLYNNGYTFAINDTILDEDTIKNYKSILEYISYIKVDISTPKENLSLVKDIQVKIISTKVEDMQMKQLAQDMGADYFQGYFYCKPTVKKEEKFDSKVESIIRLSNKIMKDCSIDELVDEFERSPIVSIQLLQFINSGLFHFRQKLSSIKQVVTLVGKTKLTQWLMLMIYATPNSKNQTNTLLFDRVKSRTYLMHEVAKIIDKSVVSNAYFVAVISLMDALFGVSQRAIMHELNVDKDIKEAIVKKDGLLGEIYSFVLALEEFDAESIDSFIQKYKISKKTLEQLTLNALVESGDL